MVVYISYLKLNSTECVFYTFEPHISIHIYNVKASFLYAFKTSYIVFFSDCFAHDNRRIAVLNIIPSKTVCKNGRLLANMIFINALTLLYSFINDLGTLKLEGNTHLNLTLLNVPLNLAILYLCIFSALLTSFEISSVFQIRPSFSHLENFLR